jgi:hypothetical protein
MDFSGGAGQGTNNDLIPNGQLAFAILTIKGIKNNSNTGSRSVECELTIDAGQPYAKKKIWPYIGDPFHNGNSEGHRQMGMVAVTRILECGKGAGPNNKAGYNINDFSDLNGLRVAIKIGIEAGSDGYDDKNKVADWLTPNPESQSGFKGYEALMRGEFAPAGKKAAGAAQPSNGFGGGNAATQEQKPATSGFGNGGASSGPGEQQSNNAASSDATSQQQTENGATNTTSPSDNPGWLQQANGS